MFASQVLWAIIGIGVIIAGCVIAYAMIRNRRLTPQEHRMGEEVTRQHYREENR